MMTCKKINKKRKRMIGIAFATGLFLFLVCFIIIKMVQGKEETAMPMKSLVQESFFFSPDAIKVTEELFLEEAAEIPLVMGEAGATVYYEEEVGYYLEKEEARIDVSMPVFQKNGATVYISEKVKQCRFFCTDFTIERGIADVWVSCGVAFNTENVRALAKDIFLINFAKDAYLVSNPFVLQGYGTETVRANTLLFFEEDKIAAYEFYDGVLQKRILPVSGDAILTIGENKVSYHEFFAYCEAAKTTNHPEMMKGGSLLEGDYFYFFLGQRYEINGPCILYRTKEGLFLENEEQAYTLSNSPLYASDGMRVILPAEYMLIQYNQRLYSCLPATTEVFTEDGQTMYLLHENFSESFSEVLLHDGEEHYLVLSEATFCLGDTELILSPLSCIYVTDNLELGVYQYENGEYSSFNTKGKKAMLKLKNGDFVFLYDRMMERSDGTLDLLLNDPTLLPVLQ